MTEEPREQSTKEGMINLINRMYDQPNTRIIILTATLDGEPQMRLGILSNAAAEDGANIMATAVAYMYSVGPDSFFNQDGTKEEEQNG